MKEGDNELALTFDSAFVQGRELEKKHGKLGLWNGDSSRLHVRKAQYKYVLALLSPTETRISIVFITSLTIKANFVLAATVGIGAQSS